MKKLKFNIVDVFAEEKYAGNQLAVFPDAGYISDIQMQKIAREMNYSETTFIISGKMENNGYNVRIFTPEKEVPFAGHPALGTAYVIQREIIGKPVKKIKLNLKAGQIPVAFKYKDNLPEKLWMKQREPEFGRILEPGAVAEVLNLKLDAIDSRSPVREVSTGLPFIIVPLTNLEAVKKAKVELNKYQELINDTNAKAILIFCPETYKEENDLNARMFAPYYGISEDPATGSANGCLAGYLLKYRYFKEGKINIRVEQGYEINRPSLLYLRAEEIEGKIDINVGGNVIMIARGELV